MKTVFTFLLENMKTPILIMFPISSSSQVSTAAVGLCLSSCQLEGICFHLLLPFSNLFTLYPVVIIPTLPQHRPPMHVGPPPKSPPLTNGCNYLPPFPHWPLHNSLSPKRSLQLSYSLPDIRFGHTPPSRLRSWSSSPTTTSLLKTSL